MHHPIKTSWHKIFVLLLWLLAVECTHKKKVYVSDCNDNPIFTKVKFTDLVKHPASFNGRYVEVSGRFVGNGHLSALENESAETSTEREQLWINFTPDCPLMQPGTHLGFFETEEGHYAKVNGRLMTLRCRIDAQKHGMHQGFAAVINDVSYLELN